MQTLEMRVNSQAMRITLINSAPVYLNDLITREYISVCVKAVR